MQLPKISIITPSYNQGQFIEQTILSVLEQNYPNLEYIIIDGGSEDNTIEIIKKYEKYLTYWISEKDEGQTHAINKGLEKTTGIFFNWLNSDDYLEKNTLLDIAEKINQNPNADVICGYTHCFYNQTNETSHTYRMGIKKNVTQTILNIEMNQPGTFYNVEKIKKIGNLNQSLHFGFDDELWFRFLSSFGTQNIVLSDKLYAHFRLHESSKSVADGFEKFANERNSVYLFIAKQLNLPDFIIKELEAEIKNNYYKSNSWTFENEFDKDEFLAHFCRKYMFNFYKNFKYLEAEFSFKKQKKNFNFDKKTFSLFVKLFIIPRFILNKIRNK